VKEYLISVIAAALMAALVGILAPEGSGKGLSGHVRLLGALFLLCVLLAPLRGAADSLADWMRGEVTLDLPSGDSEEDYGNELESAIRAASWEYAADLLSERLETEFSLPTGEVRCLLHRSDPNAEHPERVSVILSGSSIWKDPARIEAYVEALLGCECAVAIE